MDKHILCRFGFHKWEDVMAKFDMTKDEEAWAVAFGFPLEFVDHHVCKRCGATAEPDYLHFEGP